MADLKLTIMTDEDLAAKAADTKEDSKADDGDGGDGSPGSVADSKSDDESDEDASPSRMSTGQKADALAGMIGRPPTDMHCASSAAALTSLSHPAAPIGRDSAASHFAPSTSDNRSPNSRSKFASRIDSAKNLDDRLTKRR